MAAKRPADAPAAAGAASSFFAPRTGVPKAARPAGPPSWAVRTRDDGVFLLRTDPACAPSAKVAAFDMDGTLVCTRHGGFPTGPSDWQPQHASVFATLRALHAGGYRIVVFSNQGGIKSALSGKRAATTKGYFDAFFGQLAVPVTALLAPQKDAYRKPLPGMWRALCALNADVAPDLSASFFVGDAAGRPADHSADDRGFAAAVGLRFYLPEEAFGGTEGAWAPLAAALAATAAAAAAQAAPEAAAPALQAPPVVPAAAATAAVIELLDSGSEEDAGYDTP